MTKLEISELEGKEYRNFLLEIGESNSVIDQKRLLYELNSSRDEFDTSAHPLELRSLQSIVDNTFTSWGNETLNHSLLNPLTDINEICAKQEALYEINSNDSLKQQLFDYFDFLTNTLSIKVLDNNDKKKIVNGVDSFLESRGRRSLRCLDKIISESGKRIIDPTKVESPYLKGLIQNISDLNGSKIEKLAQGPKFKQWFRNDVYNIRELKPTIPIPFLPVPAPSILAAGAYCLYKLWSSSDLSTDDEVFSCALLSIPMIGLTFSVADKIDDIFQNKICKRYKEDLNFTNTIRSIGKLDELLSFEQMRQDLVSQGLPVSIPKVTDSEKHYFQAQGLVNLVEKHEQQIQDYIQNDVNLSGLTFYTGPNSGGKSSLTKAIGQAQVLAQMGGYIPANSGDIAIADKIFYQVGRNDTQADKEGGFGTQLNFTKRTFFSSSPKSLFVIDDLIDGTSFEEKTEISTDQLSAFTHLGANVLYVSHHHELAQSFKDQNSGSFYQIEFDGKDPTHRLIPGICTQSHAQRVAKNSGFAPEDMKGYLVQNGWLDKSQELRDLTQKVKEIT